LRTNQNPSRYRLPVLTSRNRENDCTNGTGPDVKIIAYKIKRDGMQSGRQGNHFEKTKIENGKLKVFLSLQGKPFERKKLDKISRALYPMFSPAFVFIIYCVQNNLNERKKQNALTVIGKPNQKPFLKKQNANIRLIPVTIRDAIARNSARLPLDSKVIKVSPVRLVSQVIKVSRIN